MTSGSGRPDGPMTPHVGNPRPKDGIARRGVSFGKTVHGSDNAERYLDP